MGRAHEVRAASIAKSAAKRATINGRAAKEIYIVARRSGTNPDSNLRLRALLEKAKLQQVPQDVVQRALKRASGQTEVNYISGCYEALGPGGSALLIDVLTTNVNRASANIRETLNKNHGNPNGKVAFMFHPAAFFVFKPQGAFSEKGDLIEIALLNNLDIINIEEKNQFINLEAEHKDFDVVKTRLEKIGVTDFVTADTTWLPNDGFLHLKDEMLAEFQNLIDKLDELEDVQNIYHNVI